VAIPGNIEVTIRTLQFAVFVRRQYKLGASKEDMTTTTAINRELKQLDQSSDTTSVIQSVSSCLTSTHGECSGYYKDQSGSVLVRCVCKCHELGGAV